MNASLKYLRAAKIEELAAQLRSDGYEVSVGAEGPDEGFDLVARKAGRKLAVEVAAQGALKDSLPDIHRLREQARDQGYDDFRLVVVNPPRAVEAEVEGIKDVLRHYLATNVPSKLAELATHTAVESVVLVEIDQLDVFKSGIHVAGKGVVDVRFDSNGAPGDMASGTDGLPFTFDVTLDPNLQLQQVHKIDIDTSSYDD